MEGFALIAIVAIVVGLMAYYGVFSSLEVGADMATAELRDAKRKQTKRIAKQYVKSDFNADEFATAKKNMAELDALEL